MDTHPREIDVPAWEATPAIMEAHYIKQYEVSFTVCVTVQEASRARPHSHQQWS